MNKNRSILIFISLALIALIVAAYFFYRPDNRKFIWGEDWDKNAYTPKYEQPYGTAIFYNILKDYFPDKKTKIINEDVRKAMLTDSREAANYIFVGGGMYLDSSDTQALLSFVYRGNTALISSKSIPTELMNFIYFDECYYEPWDDYELVADTFNLLYFADPNLQGFGTRSSDTFYLADKNKPVPYYWSYIDDRFFCDEQPQEVLGRMDSSRIFFARFPYGEGTFYLHTTPLALTNFHLLRPEGKSHTETLLSYLPEGDILWDEDSRTPERIARKRNNPNRSFPDDHPLAYMLQHKSLAWAWYLLVGLAGIYVLFRAKRRQRIIPVLPKNENSSYEFISTIANLHFREKNYRSLCIQTMKLFLAQVRERYGLVAVIQQDEELPRYKEDYIQRLAQVSGVSEREINDIFTQYKSVIQFEPTQEMMTQLHFSIEQFSKKAK
jgi:hypothetical protein